MQQHSIHTLQAYITKNCNNIVLDSEVIKTYFEEKTLPKKSNFLSAGEICKHEGFIITGCCKTYITDSNGNEIIVTLNTENWWVSDLASFEKQTPFPYIPKKNIRSY